MVVPNGSYLLGTWNTKWCLFPSCLLPRSSSEVFAVTLRFIQDESSIHRKCWCLVVLIFRELGILSGVVSPACSLFSSSAVSLFTFHFKKEDTKLSTIIFGLVVASFKEVGVLSGVVSLACSFFSSSAVSLCTFHFKKEDTQQ